MTVNSGKWKTARAIFSPAIGLLSRLSYAKKFTLLWLTSLTAIAVVVYGLFASLEGVIHPSRQELRGLALIDPIPEAVRLIQLHRGMSSALLGGDATMRERRAEKEEEAAQAFKAMEARLPPSLTSRKDFRDIKADWEKLREEGLRWTADENFAAHTRLIDRIQLFEVSVADDYALTLDPKIDTYYLIDTTLNKLPRTLEHLGQLRAYGALVLTEKRISESRKNKLNVLIAGLDGSLRELEINLEKVGRYSPAAREPLLKAADGIVTSARQVAGLVTSDILAGRFSMPPGVFLDTATVEIDKGYAQMREIMLPTARALLEARIAKAENMLRASVGITSLLFLLVVYIAFGIYYVILGGIKTLVHSAHTFAEGDLTQRVRFETRDELSRIGDSFNRMADGFNALLEEHKQAKGLLLSIIENAPAQIFWKDRDSRYLGCNTSFAKGAGYSAPEEVAGKTDFDMAWKNYAESYRADDKAVMDSGIPKLNYEEPFTTPDGDLAWAQTSKVPLRDENNRIIGVLGIYQDITERKREEESRRVSEAKFRSIFNSSQVSFSLSEISEIDSKQVGKLVDVNPTFCQVTGYSRDEAIGKTTIELGLIGPADQQRLLEIANQDGELINYEFDLIRHDGTTCPVSLSRKIIYIEDRPYRLGVAIDISKRKQAERALIESKDRLHKTIETALDAVVQMDAAGIITGWNAQAEKVFGWTREEAVGRTLGETIIPPQYREAHQRGLQRFLSNGEGSILNTRVEMTGLRRDGSEFPVELGITSIRAAGEYEFSGFIRDITERKKAEEAIWKEANFDALTGLPNRHMFYDRLAQELRKAERIRLPIALLYIDLDHFKEINDTLGHSMGDKVLVETARRIGACVRETDTVARLGGDEFIIILTELGETTRIDALAQNILNRLVEPFHLNSEALFLSASIGITLYPHDAAAMEELVKNADQAMYAAKNTGRNRFSYFTQSMQEAAQNRMRLTSDLRGALAAGQFRLHYQPIVDLLTGRIHKAEALIRWQHPLRGPVSPIEFIPLAEETGLILGIGDWVFREAAHQVKRWRTHYDPEFQVSVNMSPAQFRGSGSPCRAWPAHLREAGLPGQSLVIEITEGLLLEKEQGVMDRLLQFHEAGVQISLDDFGTGYSSLSYLQKFDIDYIKIDQSFTRKLEPGSGSLALSEAIIVMAHRLGLKVIAEGVETEAQRDLLAVAGCDYGQGYLFSKPLPAAEFGKLLKAAAEGDKAE